MIEVTYIVSKMVDGKRRYLMHEGHTHKWTPNIKEAMLYTKIEVAEGLAKKYGGEAVVDVC